MCCPLQDAGGPPTPAVGLTQSPGEGRAPSDAMTPWGAHSHVCLSAQVSRGPSPAGACSRSLPGSRGWTRGHKGGNSAAVGEHTGHIAPLAARTLHAANARPDPNQDGHRDPSTSTGVLQVGKGVSAWGLHCLMGDREPHICARHHWRLTANRAAGTRLAPRSAPACRAADKLLPHAGFCKPARS